MEFESCSVSGANRPRAGELTDAFPPIKKKNAVGQKGISPLVPRDGIGQSGAFLFVPGFVLVAKPMEWSMT